MTLNKVDELGLPETSGSLNRLPFRSTDELRSRVHPRICLLGADYLNSNLGIRALTTGAITAIFAQHPDADVKILEYGLESCHFFFDLLQSTVSVPMLNMRFSKRLWAHNHIVRLIGTALMLKVIPSRLRANLIARNPLLKELSQADYVLALSGGDSFSDIYGLQRLIYMALPQILALSMGKTLIQLPQTIGPFKRRISRRIARWVLSRSALVYSRDQDALPQIRSLVPDRQAERVRFCPDLGFVVPAVIPPTNDPQLEEVFSAGPVVGFNVSGLLYMGGYTRKNMFGLASDYKALVQMLIRYFIKVKRATILLVPHVATYEGEGDALVCDHLFQQFQHEFPGRVFTLPPLFDERQIKYFIGKCEFFTGARMHSCIAALSQCVPTAAMAYSDKFAGVLKSAGMQDAIADLRTLSIDQAIEHLSSLYDLRTSLRSRLESKIPLIKAQVLGLLERETRNDFVAA
jgi:polysaccharide pyruvyl transferase WcaK-like protein